MSHISHFRALLYLLMFGYSHGEYKAENYRMFEGVMAGSAPGVFAVSSLRLDEASPALVMCTFSKCLPSMSILKCC